MAGPLICQQCAEEFGRDVQVYRRPSCTALLPFYIVGHASYYLFIHFFCFVFHFLVLYFPLHFYVV